MPEIKKEDKLEIRATFNGKKYAVTFTGEDALVCNDYIIDKLKGTSKKDEITDYA